MRRVRTITMAAVATLALMSGCHTDSPSAEPGAAPPVPVASTPAAPTGSAQPSAPGPAGASPADPSTAPPAPAAAKLKVGAKGAEVVALQTRLNELGYWNGKADGKFGGTTQQAVYALQKAAGLGRDGVLGAKTRQALEQGVRPKPRSTDGRVVEIDLKRQLLMIVENGRIQQIFNTSTGSNDHYRHDGRSYLADTPRGRFTVGRQIDGLRIAPLGELWRPKYFNGGIAVHGAPSVPPYPASHGCARLSNAAMNWVWATDAIPLKTRVWVY